MKEVEEVKEIKNEMPSRAEKNKNISKTKSKKKKKKMNYKFFYILWGFLGVLFIIIAVVTGFMFGTRTNTQSKVTKLGLNDVGELVTQTCRATIVKDSKNHRDFFKLFNIPFTQSRQIFSYDFEVDASLDFAAISYKVDDNNSKIIITLPHAKLYKTTIVDNSLKVYFENESIFNNIDSKEQEKLRLEMKEEASKECEKYGMLAAAEDNAKKLLEGMIKSNAEFKDYKIEYKFKE